MKQFFSELFIWWHGQTFGMRVNLWLHGVFVGKDEAGNRYFRSRKGNRRWVVYNGPAEASAIGQGWHGWMHHRTDTPPTEETYQPHEWELPHHRNLTGTAGAYRPDGSLLSPGDRPRVSGDYDAWSPE